MHTSTCLKNLFSFSISFSSCFISPPTIFSSPALRGLSFLSTYTCTPRALNIPNSNLIQRQASHVASLSFTALTLQRSEGTIRSILHHPFNQKALDSTLPLEIFKRYLREDIAYIRNYIALLEKISMCNSCSRLHKAFFNNLQQTQSNALQRCYQYLEKHERIFSKNSLSVEILLANLLPCPWIYCEIAHALLPFVSDNNPYKYWFKTYTCPLFTARTKKKIKYLNWIAEKASKSTQISMLEAFENATHFEYTFWDAVYYQS